MWNKFIKGFVVLWALALAGADADVTVVVGRAPTSSAPSTLLTGLVAHWSFNEASGVREDSHTNNQDLADTTTVPSTTGILGNALDAEFVDGEYVSISDNATISLGADSSFTICGFFKLESKPAFPGPIINKSTGPSTAIEFEVYWDPGVDKILLDVSDGVDSLQIASTETAFTLGTWYFFAAGRDGSTNTTSMQINAGTPNTVSDGTVDTQDGTGTLAVGARAWNAGYAFDGAIDELGYWSRVLTAPEIAAYYNGGAGIAYPF